MCDIMTGLCGVFVLGCVWFGLGYLCWVEVFVCLISIKFLFVVVWWRLALRCFTLDGPSGFLFWVCELTPSLDDDTKTTHSGIRTGL